MKSKMLFWINEIDGRFRDLVLLVKEWAKTHHINDSKSGTLNSYSLSLLVVFHLQTLAPPLLPPLREIYPRNMVDDLTGVRAVAEKHIEETCAVNINRIKSDKLRLINRSSLSELFITFLAKVEDPFEQPANTARTVSSNQLIKISDAIQATHGILTSSNQNQTSLISVLAGEHVSRLVTRASVSTPVIKSGTRNPGANHSRYDLKTRPERKQTPLQTQNKSQSKRMDKRQNDGTNGHMHASTSQKQQVWRPRSQTKVDQIGSDG
ncbi:UNVERIFIED_CONTAM: protein HESO1 [Sesamum radiatum]|uniref:Protein HESO1 n=1 Tax=Sesamum radiatum TaxID=300843 RepID=A0AAW2JXJ5_SESRA